MIAVERIRQTLAAEVFTFGTHNVVATASFGLASLNQESKNFLELVSRADEALYCAKRAVATVSASLMKREGSYGG
jgi:PleD family two-component response regulator